MEPQTDITIWVFPDPPLEEGITSYKLALRIEPGFQRELGETSHLAWNTMLSVIHELIRKSAEA